jgi:tRNA dimethylallyltransferase
MTLWLLCRQLKGFYNSYNQSFKLFLSFLTPYDIMPFFSAGSRKQKLIAVVGPTASGKSELAVALAKKFNGEIISVDSRQVYLGMNIGTGKVEGGWRQKIKNQKSKIKITNQNSKIFIYKKIPHWCIDFVSPKQQYSIAKYQQCANEAIRDIASRGKVPILCGGTGFWIDAVIYDITLPNVPPDKKLRRKLAKKSAKELLAILKKLDPARAKTIEQKNPRRIIRAIEIARSLGKVPKLKKRQRYQTLWLGIKKPREELRDLIALRLQKRLKQGMIREVQRLVRNGVSHKRLQELGLEYKFVSLFLQKKLQKSQMIQILQRAIEQYARRQEVWFKRNKKIRWIASAHETEKLTKRFLS